jgi:hypothetical protein
MRWTIFSVWVLGFTLAIVSLTAQENIRLRFDVYKNGSQIASPTMVVKDKETGSMKVDGVADLSFTPSRIDANKIAVALDVVSGDMTAKPRLVLLNQESVSLSWKSATDSFEILIAAVR